LSAPARGYHALRVAAVIDETPDARSFVFELPSELAPLYRYKAGQFLTFQVALPDEMILRCYSLSSAPETDAAPKVTVKRVEGGRGSNWFNDTLAVGASIPVLPPTGLFVLRDSSAPLCFFAGGSGITPVISLIKSGLVTSRRRMLLIYANRDAVSVIFRAELDELERQHPDRLRVAHHLDAEKGFLEARQARSLIAGFEGAHFYICGPGPFMDVVESMLLAAGTERERIFIERFISLPSHQEVEAENITAAGEVAGQLHPSVVTIHLDGHTHRAPYQVGDTVLETARKAGLEPPFACEDGYCGSCAAKLVRGEVKMHKNEVFSAKEVAAGNILTCQSRPCSGELEVSYD
jgi:3-ketosteroid 9alpha-monooxygenase subunit B